MKIHHTELTYTATASTQQTGYEVTNINNTQVRKQWRTTDLVDEWARIDLGSALTPASLWLQDVNFASALIERSTDGAAFFTVGTMTMGRDIHDRRKGSIALSGSIRHLRVTPQGSPTDNASYFFIGAAYVFSSIETAPKNPRWGLRRVCNYPQDQRHLANGRSIVTEYGPAYVMIEGEVEQSQGVMNEDVFSLVRRGRAGVIGVDLEDALHPELAWPMKFYEQAAGQVLASPAYWPMRFSLKEVV